MKHETLADGVEIYCGDCRDILPTLGRVDAVVTDPPYGINVCTKGGLKSRGNRPYAKKQIAHVWQPVYGDDAPFEPAQFLGFSNIVLWGANNYASRLPDSPCWFCFDRKTERGADSDITDCELAWVRGLPYKTVRIFRHMWAGFQRDSETGQRHLHPTQKPVALMKWCIEFFPSARTILDPFMGSGTTGVAAVKLGRRFIGCEIHEPYYDIARRRIEAALREPDLFIEAPKPAKQEAFI